MEMIGVIGGILAIVVSLVTVVSFYRGTIKEAEERGKFLQEFVQLREAYNIHEVKINKLSGGQEELERAFLEQSLLLKHLTEKLDEISADLKELVKDHNSMRHCATT